MGWAPKDRNLYTPPQKKARVDILACKSERATGQPRRTKRILGDTPRACSESQVNGCGLVYRMFLLALHMNFTLFVRALGNQIKTTLGHGSIMVCSKAERELYFYSTLRGGTVGVVIGRA